MRIGNVNGASGNTCTCGSWLKHWEKFSGKPILFCSEKSCTKTELVGAHVQKMTSNDWYIIPLCQEYNKSKDDLEVVDSTVFVYANRSETCEKK